MPEPTYTLSTDGVYAFYRGTDSPLFHTEEVAILFDVRDAIVLKHGCPEVVTQTHRTMCERYRTSGFEDVADDLVLIQGKFDLADLNRIVQHPDYIGVFYGQLQQGTAS